MSSFVCSACGTLIIDSPRGYLTGCEHWPLEGQEKESGSEVVASVQETSTTVQVAL